MGIQQGTENFGDCSMCEHLPVELEAAMGDLGVLGEGAGDGGDLGGGVLLGALVLCPP